MVFDEDPPTTKSSNPLEKWSQQATTSAFGFMDSLRGQGSSLAKGLKSFGKTLMKDSNNQPTGPPTPPEHRCDDIRLTWLTNRLVLADTLHNSKDGLIKAEKAVVREMMDCQPYVVVNVHPEPLRLDGYAKSIHVPLGSTQKGGLSHHPTIEALIPILNEYCLLTNDAAIVIFGADENVVITAAFCLIASRSLSRIPDFLYDSLQTRFNRLPVTYKIFIEQTQSIVKMLTNRSSPSLGVVLNAICLEPGNLLIEGEVYIAVQQGIDQLKVFEFSTNKCQNNRGQLIFALSNLEALDDVVIFIGQKGNVKQPLVVVRFNTQLLEGDDSDIVFTTTEMDVSRMIAQPVQDLRMIVNFATRRATTHNSLNFDRYKLLCVRNDRELDGYQRSYGSVDSEDESPILKNHKSREEKKEGGKGSSGFFDTLQFSHEQAPSQRGERLLDDHSGGTADLLGGFSIGDENEFNLSNQEPVSDFFSSSTPNETPILSAPTPLNSDYEEPTRIPSPTPAIDDLLGLGNDTSHSSSNLNSNTSKISNHSNSGTNLVDFDFGAPLKPTSSNANLSSSPVSSAQSWSNADLLGGFSPMKPTTTSTPPNSMASSAASSKPVSTVNSQSDFDAFLSNYPEKPISSQTQYTKPSAATTNINKNVPPKPQYKPAFGGEPASSGAKVSMDAFSDLLNQGGFKATTRENQKKSIGTLLKQEQAKNLTPEEIKIRDWTQGKERNIRALLGSLQNVLWDGADKWNQPSMGDLLSPDQIKKHYRKACLVVHPDKLTGSPHLPLAKMIFTELNDAYSKYTNDPSIS